jgi:hypothetical protein
MVSDAIHAAGESDSLSQASCIREPITSRSDSKGTHVMQPFITTAPTLAVSVIYCIWQAYARDQQRRRALLHERVAFMLWTLATQAA